MDAQTFPFHYLILTVFVTHQDSLCSILNLLSFALRSNVKIHKEVPVISLFSKLLYFSPEIHNESAKILVILKTFLFFMVGKLISNSEL